MGLSTVAARCKEAAQPPGERPLPLGRHDEGLEGNPVGSFAVCAITVPGTQSAPGRKYRSPAAPFSFQEHP